MTLVGQRDRPRSQSRPAALRIGFAAGIFCVLTAVALAAPTDGNEVISPKALVEKSAPPAGGPGAGAFTAVAVVLLAGAGGWMLWRGKTGGLAQLSRAPRQLAIEETRSLGNRQFLVVATYQDRKYLLGVCPGRIDLLAPLNESTPSPEKPRP